MPTDITAGTTGNATVDGSLVMDSFNGTASWGIFDASETKIAGAANGTPAGGWNLVPNHATAATEHAITVPSGQAPATNWTARYRNGSAATYKSASFNIVAASALD